MNSDPAQLKPLKSILQVTLIGTWLGLLLIPGYIFFTNRGGVAAVLQTDPLTLSKLIFPLFGLYAFFFVWTQIMIGSNRRWLRQLYPYSLLLTFHIFEGVAALIFALTHPLLILIGYGAAKFFSFGFTAPQLYLYVWLGILNYFLIILTASAGLLRRLPWLKTRWRTIHYANYILFVTVWIHSWYIGSDIQSTNLRYLWIFFGATYLISIIGRFGHPLTPQKNPAVQKNP